MSILSQKTLSKKISFQGIGVHTGNNSKINVYPAKPNTGIIFKRIDLVENNIIYPNYLNVTDTTLCTTISNQYGVKVSTIEHLMGAFYGIGIDNAIVEIDSQEVPILDGSAKYFLDEINKTGLIASDVPIKIIKINKNIRIEEGNKFISIEKSNVTSDIEFEIKYKTKLIGTQKNKVNIFEDNLVDIYNSRTFCLYEDIEKIKAIGLAKGGSLENAIVVQGEKVLNKEGLRCEKEFVNHKILDLAGDFMLSGMRVIGSINFIHGGHSLTNKFLRKIIQEKDTFVVIEGKSHSINIRKVHPVQKRLVVNA